MWPPRDLNAAIHLLWTKASELQRHGTTKKFAKDVLEHPPPLRDRERAFVANVTRSTRVTVPVSPFVQSGLIAREFDVFGVVQTRRCSPVPISTAEMVIASIDNALTE